MSRPSARSAQVVASAAGLVVGGLAFFLTLLDYGTDLTRTATRPGWFSNFYDLQAHAFLAGHLDVPAGSKVVINVFGDTVTETYSDLYLPDGVDPTLVQQVLDVAERQREANVEHDSQSDDLR